MYEFTVNVLAKGLASPESRWSEWNWNRDTDKKDDGSKTRGLSTFLNGLTTIYNQSMEKKPLPIARFCYRIQKE